MPLSKNPPLSKLLREVENLRDSEDDKYDDIPGWDGLTIEAMTDKAVLLKIKKEDVWFPLGQLREAHGEVVASKWVLDQKGLG